ncbi:MAG: hypothetical protein IKL48_02295, partial [Elusimicrobiaceae bacterium]|nr:hypothetical protein [Elusimicrobiaceae bacterium]
MTFHSSFKTWLGKVAPVLLLPVLFLAAQSAFAQSAEVRSMGVYYKNTASGFGINDVYCNWKTANLTDADYKGGIVNVAGKNTSDPWQTSALIEYDQPYPSPTENNSYPNHCLGLCMDVYCTNKPNGSATYSVAFPIQNVRFEIAKYYASNDIGNPEKSPAVRTIDMSLQNNYITDADPGSAIPPTNTVDLSQFMCASYTCYGASANWEKTSTCPNPLYECRGGQCYKLSDGKLAGTAAALCGSNFENGEETPCIKRADGTGKGYNDPIRFCTSWDGSYEILGEFGKTNGQFGVRGTIHTDYPGDG